MAIDPRKLREQRNELRGRVKEKWGQLTDDELTIRGGDFDRLVGRIQKGGTERPMDSATLEKN
jgi:uncharacterized protein YjbJ (UPF0337 family)